MHCLNAVSRLAQPSTLYPEDAQQSVVLISFVSANGTSIETAGGVIDSVKAL